MTNPGLSSAIGAVIVGGMTSSNPRPTGFCGTRGHNDTGVHVKRDDCVDWVRFFEPPAHLVDVYPPPEPGRPLHAVDGLPELTAAIDRLADALAANTAALLHQRGDR